MDASWQNLCLCFRRMCPTSNLYIFSLVLGWGRRECHPQLCVSLQLRSPILSNPIKSDGFDLSPSGDTLEHHHITAAKDTKAFLFTVTHSDLWDKRTRGHTVRVLDIEVSIRGNSDSHKAMGFSTERARRGETPLCSERSCTQPSGRARRF